MNASAALTAFRSAASARSWRWWVPLLAVVVLALTLPFWLSDLDIRAASLFYTPVAADAPREQAWPLAQHGLFLWLYRTGSGLSWLSLIAAFVAIAVPRLRRNAVIKRSVTVLLLTLVIGPGLLVNGLGKDFTGRPRPRTVTEFGGYSNYRPPLDLGTPGTGKSFPCGHCSVGFAVGSVGLAVIESERVVGIAVIAFSLLLGGAIGVARMADGAHFFSDVLWAALLTWLAAFGANRLFKWWDARGAALQSRARWLAPAVMGLVAVALVTGLLFARPFHQKIKETLDGGTGKLALDLDDADLEVRVDPAQHERLRLTGEVKGFGVPNLTVAGAATQASADGWSYRLQRHGKASEVEAPLLLSVRPDALAQLDIRIRRGGAVLLAAPGATLQPLALDARQHVVIPALH